MMDENLLDATIRVLASHGWDGLTLERVAVEAGQSRPTLWRRGVTRESLVKALLGRLTDDYRRALWPILTASGPANERLAQAIDALCDVLDAHLPLLRASDTAFHVAGRADSFAFEDPIERLLRDGQGDGTIVVRGDPRETALVLFNAVCWTYVHLRAAHDWTPEHARADLVGLLLGSLTPAPTRG